MTSGATYLSLSLSLSLYLSVIYPPPRLSCSTPCPPPHTSGDPAAPAAPGGAAAGRPARPGCRAAATGRAAAAAASDARASRCCEFRWGFGGRRVLDERRVGRPVRENVSYSSCARIALR
ncbi:hypothetical protein IWZ03DRAFT_96918 [Phyllosticta citriasiana]|uniref:Uncharacterized protein n=1 Tax=Phyllosticta citriasiana TaxID=595635 RepID=A0ABR1KUU6_9PEZI